MTDLFKNCAKLSVMASPAFGLLGYIKAGLTPGLMGFLLLLAFGLLLGFIMHVNGKITTRLDEIRR